jgi:hypothetical protein
MVRKSVSALVILLGAVWALLTIHPATPVTPISEAHPVSVVRDSEPMPACTYEDGSGQALCMWDASEQGNGMGTDVIAGDCSIGTVGTYEASNACLTLWGMDVRFSYGQDGSISETHKGSELVDDCLTIEWEASNDKAIREQLNSEGWNLAECFKAHIQN